MDPRGLDPRDQDLSNRRVGAIRDALINAGVPASRIQLGAFGDTRLTRDRRVAVLLCTVN
jgi:outer membrane protein OmpA-like peptidoglycan-associated protein